MSESSLSNGWRTFRFDEMATLVNDRIQNPSKANVDYYIGLEHLDSDSLTIRRWGSPSDVEATKLRFRAGDIIFGRRRVYQRKLGVAHFDGICSAHAMVLRAKPEVALPEFLPFFMQSDLFMERAKEISVGSLSPTINWKTLANERFALPSPAEQRRIARVLHSTRDLNDALAILEESCCQILASAAAQEFDQLHQRSIATVSLASICSRRPQSGIYKSDEFRGRGVPMVSMGEIFANDVIDSDIEMNHVCVDGDELRRYALTPNDLLFGRRSVVLEGAGKCVLVGELPGPVVFESSVLRVTIDPECANNRYVFEWLRSPYGHQQIRRMVTFTTVSGVAGASVARLPVPLPPLIVQEEIADRLLTLRRHLDAPRKRSVSSAQLSATVIHEVFREDG